MLLLKLDKNTNENEDMKKEYGNIIEEANINTHVLILSTNDSSGLGGIANAMEGYMNSLATINIPFTYISTHSAGLSGKWVDSFIAAADIIRKTRELQKEGTKVFVYAHAGQWFSLFRKYLLLRTARSIGAETILQFHSVYLKSWLENQYKKKALTAMLSTVDKVCLLTPWWEKQFRKAEISKKVYVVPNPLSFELESRAKKAEIREEDGTTRILTLCRLESGKGVDVVIKAMRLLPNDVILYIAGDGSMRRTLIKLTRDLQLSDRIRFLGWVERKRRAELYSKANIFCVPSNFDSFGLVFVEAMAYGVPVIGYDWGPISDVVPNGIAGKLIKERSPKEIASAVTEIMDCSIRTKMGSKGKTWVLSKYSAKTVGRSMSNVFLED